MTKYPMKCRCGNEYAIELPEGQPFKTDDEKKARCPKCDEVGTSKRAPW